MPSRLPISEAKKFCYEHGLSRYVDELERNVSNVEPGVLDPEMRETSAVRRGYSIQLFEDKGLLDVFLKNHWLGATNFKLNDYREQRTLFEHATGFTLQVWKGFEQGLCSAERRLGA